MPPEDQEPLATWDSVSATPTADAPEVVEPVVEAAPVIPPAETPTLEKPETAPLAAEPVAARESESETIVPEAAKEETKDEDVQEGDTPEIMALPSGSSARRWARRQFHDAAPINDFQSFDKPISAFADELFKRSESRYVELVNDLTTQHSDHVSKQLFGLPLAEVKAKLAQTESPNAPIPPTPSTATAQPVPGSVALPLTEAELEDMTLEQVSERLTQYHSTQEQRETQLKQEVERLAKQNGEFQKQLDAVTGKISQTEASGHQKTIEDNQQKLYKNVWSVVEEGIRATGLEAQPTDPPRIANLKLAAQRLLGQNHIEAAFDANEENLKLVNHVVEATKRGEFQNAFREEDNLKVRARAAFETVKQSPEVQAILSEIEAYANQSKSNSREATNPVPPAPGAAGGMQVKPPGTWDEAIAQAQAAS